MESKHFARYKYKMESSVFMLKPIVDKFYEEATIYKERIRELEKKVRQLEEEKTLLLSQTVKNKADVVVIGDDDDVYADEALAPPASSLVPIIEDKPIEVVETSTTSQEDNKDNKLINVSVDKSRKEYMKEYQRNYRKKQKENALKQ